MSDYAPTEEDVRYSYADWEGDRAPWNERVAEFDRWLATHDRDIREQIAKAVEAVIDTSPWYVRLRYGLLEAVKIIRDGDQR